MDEPPQSAVDVAKEAHLETMEQKMEAMGLKLGEIVTFSVSLLLDEAGVLKHRYFKSTWYTVYKPYMQCPYYIKGYDATKKVFTIQVLWDGRELAIPVGSTAIPITEEEAEQLKQQKRAYSQTKPQPQNQINMSEETATATTEPPLSERPPKAPKEKKSRVRDDGRKPIRQICLEGFAAGKERKAVVDDILVIYPEKDRTKAGQLASLYKYNEKNKDKPKKEKAAPETPAEAAPAEPEAAPATA